MRTIISPEYIRKALGRCSAKAIAAAAAMLVAAFAALLPLPAQAAQPPQDNSFLLKKKGDALYNACRYTEALDYYTAGLGKAQAEKNDDIYQACIGNIGNIYAMINDYKRALHYFKKGYQASVKVGNKEMQWKFAVNMVILYAITGQPADAKAFFKVQCRLPIKDITQKRFYFLQNSAYIALAEGKLDLADYYVRTAISYAIDSRLPTQYVASTYIDIGKLEMRKGNAQKAIAMFKVACDSARNMKSNDMLVSAYKHLSDAYQEGGNPDSAQKYHSLYLNLSDSVFNLAQLNVASGKLFEYENNENAQHISRLMSQNYALITAVAVFVTLAAILTILSVALRRKNRRLQESQQALVEKNNDLMQSDANNRTLLDKYINAINELQQDQGNSQSHAQPKDERTSAAMGDEQKNRLLKSIIEVMEDVKAISAPDFDMKQLAERIGSNQSYVSFVINDTYGKNFRTLLNEYRIREAVKRMSDRERYGNMTIQAIYEELGWKSAASFISAFKKVNGMTPSEYQKAMLKK